ncbi:unnamed protein product [Lactuca virosa]|uniref:Uncharacterized protein n=1 Tax=Lactuca virosa TaxID=75947 RepID=A0AAU9LZ87_9ASTR|nr:unnamed protein product [Lactuca virosa]
MYNCDYPATQYTYFEESGAFELELENPMRYVPCCTLVPALFSNWPQYFLRITLRSLLGQWVVNGTVHRAHAFSSLLPPLPPPMVFFFIALAVSKSLSNLQYVPVCRLLWVHLQTHMIGFTHLTPASQVPRATIC